MRSPSPQLSSSWLEPGRRYERSTFLPFWFAVVANLSLIRILDAPWTVAAIGDSQIEMRRIHPGHENIRNALTNNFTVTNQLDQYY
jgi:hypothetical protein